MCEPYNRPVNSPGQTSLCSKYMTDVHSCNWTEKGRVEQRRKKVQEVSCRLVAIFLKPLPTVILLICLSFYVAAASFIYILRVNNYDFL